MAFNLELINDDNTLAHWLVVDAIRVPDVAQQAYKYEPFPELFRLFSNTKFEHLIDISPVVFQFTGTQGITTQLKSDFAFRSSSVIFSFAEQTPINTLKQHLHDLTSILVEGHLVFFRYYSSVFWEKLHSA